VLVEAGRVADRAEEAVEAEGDTESSCECWGRLEWFGEVQAGVATRNKLELGNKR